MALPLLSSADYPAIREALRIGLDSTALPDATIARDVFYGVAEREIVAAYADAATEADATKLLHLKAAAVFLTAANLAGSLALPDREEFLTYRYQLPPSDWRAREADLRGRAAAALAAVTGAATIPTLFTVACGARGRA